MIEEKTGRTGRPSDTQSNPLTHVDAKRQLKVRGRIERKEENKSGRRKKRRKERKGRKWKRNAGKEEKRKRIRKERNEKKQRKERKGRKWKRNAGKEIQSGEICVSGFRHDAYLRLSGEERRTREKK